VFFLASLPQAVVMAVISILETLAVQEVQAAVQGLE
jgi:hypothetical protein